MLGTLLVLLILIAFGERGSIYVYTWYIAAALWILVRL